MPWVGQDFPQRLAEIRLRIELTAKFSPRIMQLDCVMAGQPSEPKGDEAVLHAKMGAKQGGGIAVVGFKRSPNQIPPLSPLCSEGPQIGCTEERSSSKGEGESGGRRFSL